MFNRYIIEDNSLKAAARMAAEMRQGRESQEKIAREEIKARNRVDISLEEYENMKKEIEKLRNDNCYFKTLFDRIEIPWDKEIIADSIYTEWCERHMDFKRTYRITFDVEQDRFSR